MSLGIGMLLLSGELVAPPPVMGPPIHVVDFEMNGAPYRMPVPDGYCVPKVTSAKLMQDVVRGKLVISPQAFFVRCDENGATLADHEFVYLKYLKGQKSPFASKAEFISGAAPTAQANFDNSYDPQAIADRAEKKTAADSGHAIKFLEMQAMPLGHDDACIYMGMKYLVRIEQSGESGSMFSMTCTTVDDGNLMTIDVSTELKEGDAVDINALKGTLNGVAKSVRRRLAE